MIKKALRALSSQSLGPAPGTLGPLRATWVGLGAMCALALLPVTAQGQDLDFDAPAVEQKSSSPLPQQIGPVSNITLGGAVD